MFGTALKPKKVIYKDRETWLANRIGIGSSEIATIVGLNPYETKFQLWQKKTGQAPAQQDNFAMKRGRYLEDAVSRFFEDESGRTVIKSSAENVLYVHPEKDFFRVSPDRLYWLNGVTRNDENKGVLECKTTEMLIDVEDLPKHWFCQLQWQLGIMQREHGSLAWLIGQRSFQYVDLAFVPEFFFWLQEQAEKFWIDNIQGGIRPEFTSPADILAYYSKHTESKTIEVTESIFDAYLKLKDVKNQLAELEAQKAELEEKIKLVFQDAESISFRGQTLATWKTSKDSERFNVDAFKESNPELYRQFVKQVAGSRRFLLK